MTPAPRNLIRALKARAIIEDDTHPQHAQVVDAVDTALELDVCPTCGGTKYAEHQLDRPYLALVGGPCPDCVDGVTADRVLVARRNVAAMTLDEFEAACEAIGLPVQLPPGTLAGRRYQQGRTT